MGDGVGALQGPVMLERGARRMTVGLAGGDVEIILFVRAEVVCLSARADEPWVFTWDVLEVTPLVAMAGDEA
jgi:hypothetical protein